jgi:glycosyltransferase involved in cell wall biosynthesis
VTPGRPRQLLTVLHSAERTGPPLFALRFLRWLREERPDWTLSTLSLGGGTDLLGAFEELGPTLVGTPADPTGSRRRRVRATAQNLRLARRLRSLGTVDLAHVHCAGSMRVVDVLPSTRVMTHVHELSVGLDLHLGPRARTHVASADHYVAVADSVRDEFVDRFDVDPGSVERQFGFVDEADLPGSVDRTELGLPADCTLVVASGVRHWRKAPELFVRVARRLVETRPDVDWRFVWVGGSDVGGLEALVASAGLASVVTFLGHRPDSLRWVASADLFFLPAREDAFPLVCVEAAALARPIVSFVSGGTPELIRMAGCGRVVEFPDVVGAARAIAELADRPEERVRLGRAGADFVGNELTVRQAGPKLLDALESTMRGDEGHVRSSERRR